MFRPIGTRIMDFETSETLYLFAEERDIVFIYWHCIYCTVLLNNALEERGITNFETSENFIDLFSEEGGVCLAEGGEHGGIVGGGLEERGVVARVEGSPEPSRAPTK